MDRESTGSSNKYFDAEPTRPTRAMGPARRSIVESGRSADHRACHVVLLTVSRLLISVPITWQSVAGWSNRQNSAPAR